MPNPLPSPILPGQPLTALAPMQDVTTLPFMRILGHYGPPDYFVTEYFRVHAMSTPEAHILASITDHGTGRPVFAQLIGEDLPHLEQTVNILREYPIAGIDINLGCPAPKVYKKNVGGGLLRDPEKVGEILSLLRAVSPHRFTVKMRIGFEDASPLDAILDHVERVDVDLLSLHARTVKQMYRGEPDYRHIAHAASRVHCPVLANGNVSSPAKASRVLASTQAAGVMIGRAAIRNPWIFRQCREHFAGQPIYQPRLREVRDYIERLWEGLSTPGFDDRRQTARMKRFLNFVGQGVDAEGRFLHDMRRTRTGEELFAVCNQYLVDEPYGSQPFPLEPFEGLLARPNREGEEPQACHLFTEEEKKAAV